MSAGELLLASKRCSECLMSGKRIVSPRRAAELLRSCLTGDVHFQCHKGTIAGVNLHCRGVHDIHPSRAYRFAVACDIPVRLVDPETLESPDA